MSGVIPTCTNKAVGPTHLSCFLVQRWKGFSEGFVVVVWFVLESMAGFRQLCFVLQAAVTPGSVFLAFVSAVLVSGRCCLWEESRAQPGTPHPSAVS